MGFLTAVCITTLGLLMVNAEVLNKRMLRVEGPTQVRRQPMPNAVALIMLDGRYQGLFDCFMKYFSDYENGPKSTSNRILDVVAYNQPAQDHVNMYAKRHPGQVRRVEAVTPPNTSALAEQHRSLWTIGSNGHDYERNLSTVGTSSGTRWPSLMYMAYYWQVIKERLDQGEHVLHMDLDSFAVGDPWDPVFDADSSADIVAPSGGWTPDAQYVFFRNTPQVRAVVELLNQQWEPFFEKAREGKLEEKLMQKPDQGAISDYLAKYNPHGCELRNQSRSHELFFCKTHAGSLIFARTHKVNSNHCGYPFDCAAEGTSVAHTFHGSARFYCDGFDLTK